MGFFVFSQFLQDVELVWGNAMLYNPSDDVVHKDALFMRNIWHQQLLKNMAKEIQFEISANCTSTPDTRLQVFLSWVRQQFEKIFPPPIDLAPAPTTPVASILPPVKKSKSLAAEADQSAILNSPQMNTAPKAPGLNSVIKLSSQPKTITVTAKTPNNASTSASDVAAHSPLHPKAVAASASVAAKEASSSCAAKVFDVSAVPIVKVSGPLLRSCSKAVSTIVGDPDMVWFVSPGEIAPVHVLSCSVS